MNGRPLVRQEDLAALRVLDEIERKPDITQRELSKRVGVSLGLTNLLIRRMARKAWIKVHTVPGRRLFYALTPRGLAEKFRKSRDFVRLSLRYYLDIRRSLVKSIRSAGHAQPEVATFGEGELFEIVGEAVREAGGRYFGAVDGPDSNGKPDAIVLLEKPSRSIRKEWERNGILLIDLI